MKKLIAVLCLLALCLPLISCSSSLSAEETGENTTATAGEKVTAEEKETGPITYPEGFSVGYSRVDVSMTPLPMYEATAEIIHDPIQLTCTAVCDGENVALLMSLDVKGIQKSLADRSMEIIEKKFNIPGENVIINATHTHSAPTVGGNSAELNRWSVLYYKQLVIVVEEALRDLDPAQAYIGVSHTEGITFVRRYLMPDGSYVTNPGSEVIAHESEADNELRTLRFDRENKKDVLMINYQTHYGGATGMYPSQLSADFIHPYRETAEEELDCYFVYHSGASGNLNFQSKIAGERKYADYEEAIDGFMITTRDALSKEEKAETGKVQVAYSLYAGTVLHDSEERVAQAKEIMAAASDEVRQTELCRKYGFSSKREASAVVTRAGYAETQEIPFTAIAFGDISFVSSPYEMFDTNGKEVREASPYKMTFVCSLTNGSFGYVPSAYAFPHGSYEVIVTRFVEGSGEEFAREMVRLLNECKNAA